MDYKWTALSVTTVGVLMAGLDVRIVIIGLPAIAQQLHAGADDVIWISQSYLLASTICMLFIGRISDIFGRVKLYVIGFAIFSAGSVLCAISLNSYQLIGFRIVQGCGAAILVTNSSAIITDASPLKELGSMLGINQTAFRLGNMAGLTLSGLVLSVVDWRWLFYVNVPIGIFGTVWAHRRLREIATKDESKKMDYAGLCVFSAGLTLILLAITFLSYGSSDWLQGVTLMFLGSITLLIFIRIETTMPSPLLDLRLFKIKQFAMGNLAQLLNSLVWNGAIVLMAVYLQIGLGYTSLEAGLSVLPLDVAFLTFSLLAGKLSDKYGSRTLCTLGLSLISTAFFVISTFGPRTGFMEFALLLALIGVGNGLFNAPNLKAIMASVPANRTGIASAFRNLMYGAGNTASYGLAILLITLGIPYGNLSQLLQNIGPTSVIAAARVEFFEGFKIAMLIFGVISALGIVPSASRGQDSSKFTQRP